MHKTFWLLGVGLSVAALGVGGATYVGAQGRSPIAQTRAIVIFSLPADSLPQIRARLMDGAIEVTAQDPNGKDLAVGELSVVDNQINPANGTIRFKATFDNMDEVLWPGQFVKVGLLGYRAIGEVIP